MSKNRVDGMSIANRLKGDIVQALIRSLLVAARYRVIDFGIEKTVRELASLPYSAYNKHQLQGLDGLGNTVRTSHQALSDLPDYVVMDFDQTISHLVEVKYRERLDRARGRDLIITLARQVRRYGEVVVILVIGNGDGTTADSAADFSDHIRCLALRYDAARGSDAITGKAEAECLCSGIDILSQKVVIHSLSKIGFDINTLWKCAVPMSQVFLNFDKDIESDEINQRSSYIRALVAAIPGIFASRSSNADTSARAA